MRDRLGSLIIDLEGKALTPDEREILAHPLVGGVIFFARHFESSEQIRALCKQIRSVRQAPFLLMTDQEGGRVQRFKDSFTRLPAMGMIGNLYNENPSEAIQLAKMYGWLMAKELLDVGIDLSLAPVLDVDKKLNTVIGDRAFHFNPNVVLTLASAAIDGMREAGMAATGKHFPGHGSVQLDSHHELPKDNRSLSEIESNDMVPFAKLIEQGIPSIMAAHILFPQIDSVPVSYSATWLNKILRNQLKFKGVIFSDDLNMEGANISSNYEDRVCAARSAGCDFTLLCNNRQAVINVLDRLPSMAHYVEKERWGALQGQFSGMMQRNDTRSRNIREKLLRFVQST